MINYIESFCEIKKMVHVILPLSRLFIISSHTFDTANDIEYPVPKPYWRFVNKSFFLQENFATDYTCAFQTPYW